MILRFLTRPLYGSVVVFLISFIAYLLTLAPGVGFIDAGELATVSATLGIAHPTGYPLFTLLGFLFSNLPIAGTVIVRLNIMSAFFSALGAGAMVFLGYEIHRHWMTLRSKTVEKAKGKGKQVEAPNTTSETKQHQSVAAGIFCGLVIAFSETWWSNATSIEVYPLHVFLITVVLVFFLRMMRDGENPHAQRDGLIFALTLGLAFTNHLTTVLLAPACLYMFFGRFGVSGGFKRITRLIPPFLLGLTPYLYLLLRSSSQPLMDWGDPENIGSFLKHVTGGQYKVWMFTGGNSGEQFKYFWSSLPSEFFWIVIILALIGTYVLFRAQARRKAHILPFLLLLFFSCVLYAINYDIHDIESYFLLAYIAFTILASCAFASIAGLNNRLSARIRSVAYVALWFGVLLALIEVMDHKETVDESGNHMVDDFTHNMLTNLPPNAIVLSSAWDFWVSGSFYWQHIEKLRPDVTVIDVALLRDRPWYYAHLQQIAPDVMRNAQAELDAFMPHLIRFDRGEPFDGAAISTAYRAFTDALVRNNSSRPIFITSEQLTERDELFAPSFRGVPDGLAYRFVERDSSFNPPVPKLQWNDDSYSKRNYYTDNARLLQAGPLAATGSLLAQQGKMAQAKMFFDLAAQFAPDSEVDITQLSKRDREFAQMVDGRFAEIETMRSRLR